MAGDALVDRIKDEFIAHAQALVERDVRRLREFGEIHFDARPFHISSDQFVGLVSEFMQVEERNIHVDDFHQWLKSVDYASRFPSYTKTYPNLKQLEKKAFEHWLSLFETKEFGDNGILDVAAATSPFYQLVRYELGSNVNSYRSDLPLPEYGYKPGVTGDTIGCSADSIPLPDISLDRIYSHNAIEHFEGNAYAGFFKEISRLLRPGGVAYICPLFVAKKSFTFVSLTGIYRRLSFPAIRRGIEMVYSDKIGQPYALHIDAEDFRRIIDASAATMDYKLVRYRGGEAYGVELGLIGTRK